MTKGRPMDLLKDNYNIPQGKCASDTNPDAWFPDITGESRPSRRALLPVALEAKRAIDICNTCPAQEKCKEAGMDPLNLTYGIWGGTLPPERITATGKTYARYSDEGKALYTMQGLKPYFNEVGLETNW